MSDNPIDWFRNGELTFYKPFFFYLSNFGNRSADILPGACGPSLFYS